MWISGCQPAKLLQQAVAFVFGKVEEDLCHIWALLGSSAILVSSMLLPPAFAVATLTLELFRAFFPAQGGQAIVLLPEYGRVLSWWPGAWQEQLMAVCHWQQQQQQDKNGPAGYL